MKVAYIAPKLRDPSGWRTYTKGFVDAVSNYVDPVLIVAGPDYETAKLLFPFIPLMKLPATQEDYLHGIFSFPTLVASLGVVSLRNYPSIDIVHSLESYPTGLIGHWLANKLNKPHVITAVGTYSILPIKYFLDRLAYQRILQKASVLCPISNETANLVQKYFSSQLSKVPVRPILLGNSYYKKIPQEVALRRDIPSIPTILSVGEVKSRKGYHISLRVFSRIKEVLPSARYWIIGNITPGNNGYCEKLKQFIADNQLEDVEFFGRVSDEELKQRYREASVFLLAPQQIGFNFEGFGLVYLEAGAYGLPVVGTRVGGVPDAIREGETGFIAEAEDVEGIAEYLLRILTDPKLAREMGLANRMWSETLTWERYAKELFEVYKTVINPLGS